MSGATIADAFGVETMVDMVKTFDTSDYDTIVQDLFRGAGVLTPNEGGESVSFDELRFDRDLAPVTGPDSPAPRVKPQDKIRRTWNLASVKLYTDIPGRRLFRERGPGQLTPNAEAVMAEEFQNLKMRVRKTVEYMSVNLLLGSLTLNNANIAGTDINVPAISPSVSTYAKANSWATAGTKIISAELQLLVNKYITACGRLPGFALINDVTETYLTGNTEVQTWAVHQYGINAIKNSPASPEVFNGLPIGGFQWQKTVHGYVPVNSDGTYTAANFTRYMPSGQAIIMPPKPQLNGILGMAENRVIIPKNAIGSETNNGLIELAEKPGLMAYTTLMENPAGVRLYVVWEGIPVIKFGPAIMNATVL